MTVSYERKAISTSHMWYSVVISDGSKQGEECISERWYAEVISDGTKSEKNAERSRMAWLAENPAYYDTHTHTHTHLSLIHI